MNLLEAQKYFRLVMVVAAILIWSIVSSNADETVSFNPEKPFSADVILTRKMQGTVINEKVYRDGEKARVETKAENETQTLIFRRDLNIQYSVLDQQKMVIETPWASSHFRETFPAGADFPQGEWDLVGPEVVNGISCSKYRTRDDITNPGLEIFFFWENTATKAPVQLADEEESFFTLWKNFVSGPQDAALFEPPIGYTVRKVGLP